MHVLATQNHRAPGFFFFLPGDALLAVDAALLDALLGRLPFCAAAAAGFLGLAGEPPSAPCFLGHFPACPLAAFAGDLEDMKQAAHDDTSLRDCDASTLPFVCMPRTGWPAAFSDSRPGDADSVHQAYNR